MVAEPAKFWFTVNGNQKLDNKAENRGFLSFVR